MTGGNRKKVHSDHEQHRLFNFIEEICWLLDSNKDINFKKVSNYLTEVRNYKTHASLNNKTTDQYNLIGILPSLLKDEVIFHSNSQLVQFANEILALTIPRWEKKSRNEIIGLIVCEVEDANKERLNILTDWSRNILNNKSKVKEMQNKAKKEGNLFSWNETIQKLVGADDE